MSSTVARYIGTNGLEPIFDFLEKYQNGEVEFHEFAEEREEIRMKDWFDFGKIINQSLNDDAPFPEFDYYRVEKELELYVAENSPLDDWDSAIEAVAKRVDAATQEDVSRWIGFAKVDTNSNGQIEHVEFI